MIKNGRTFSSPWFNSRERETAVDCSNAYLNTRSSDQSIDSGPVIFLRPFALDEIHDTVMNSKLMHAHDTHEPEI